MYVIPLIVESRCWTAASTPPKATSTCRLDSVRRSDARTRCRGHDSKHAILAKLETCPSQMRPRFAAEPHGRRRGVPGLPASVRPDQYSTRHGLFRLHEGRSRGLEGCCPFQQDLEGSPGSRRHRPVENRARPNRRRRREGQARQAALNLTRVLRASALGRGARAAKRGVHWREARSVAAAGSDHPLRSAPTPPTPIMGVVRRHFRPQNPDGGVWNSGSTPWPLMADDPAALVSAAFG